MSSVVSGPTRPAIQEGARPRWRPSGRSVFFGVVFLILLGYTEMAFQMDWITPGDRIGPGFFPRIVGVLGSLIAAGALVDSLRRRPENQDDELIDEDEVGVADHGHHPVTLVAVIMASGILLVTLTSLGAILSSAIFMVAVLSYLNPRRWVVNVALSVLIPLALYLLFQTALNAGLPNGILPRF